MTEILRGREPLGPRVRSVRAMPGYKLDLTFTTGERRVFDAKGLLEYPAYRRLRDEAFFLLADVAYGTVCWPGDLDCCPDRLYQESREIGGKS